MYSFQAWGLVTNGPAIPARLYARRYWQDARFRDLKSEGWHWQASPIFTPLHANRLLLVWSLAYACVLSLGTLALEEPDRTTHVLDQTCSVFRKGLRVWDALLGQVHAALMNFTQPFWVFLDPLSLKSVRP